jgi:hypothetical protein
MNTARQAKRLRRQQDHEAREHELNARLEREANRRDTELERIPKQAQRELEMRRQLRQPHRLC